MSRILRAFVLVLLSIPVSVLFAADPASSDAILRKVDDHYNHLASLRARYTEHYSGMGLNRTESGTLLLRRPGRMRWSYDHPAGKVFVLDGRFGWFYTPGNAEAQRIPARQLDDLRSPLRFLLGHTQLSKELDHLMVTPDSGGYIITGVPRGMEQRIRLLSLGVNSSNAIERMKIEEIDGSVTEFTFSAIEENVPVKDSDFTFQVPAGVTIVNGLPPV